MERSAVPHDPYRQSAPSAAPELENLPEIPPSETTGGGPVSDGHLGVGIFGFRNGKLDYWWSTDPEDLERARLNQEQERRREAEERARRKAEWGPHSERMRSDLGTLIAFLDRAIVVEARSIDQWRELVEELHFHFPLAEVGLVHPQEFRAAAALAEIWIAKTDDRVGAALEWACGYSDKMRRLYTAVREGPRALPWRVLRPLSRLRAYEVRPHRSGYAVPPPSAATLAALPQLRTLYVDFIRKISAALNAGENLQRWRFEQAKLTTQGGDSLDRAFAASVASRLGDQLTNAELTDDAVHVLYQIGEKVHAHCQHFAEYLAGTKLGTLERRGVTTLKTLGDIAAGLARVINPCIRDRRRYPKGGVYRGEVQARVVAIMEAVYGVTVPPATVKSRTQKRVDL